MTRADLAAIIVAIAVLPFVYRHFWQAPTAATQARIIDAQQHVNVAMLDREQTLHVHGKLGDSVLQIQRGQIRFIQSPCTTKFCIHSGWLKHSGEVTACLPNGVFVEVVGATRKFDSINF